MIVCPECARLRGESASAFAEYTACKDELAITRKTDKSFATQRRAFERAKGQLSECHKSEAQHHAEAHSTGSSAEFSNTAESFARLREFLDISNAAGVQRAIFELSPIYNKWSAIPDEVVERLLTLLRSGDMYESPFAGYVLHYFEFEALTLTARQKWLCLGFLNAHGDQFTHVYSRQIVAELREGNYLISSANS